MNFSNILSHIAETDPEVYERTSERRSVIKNWMRGVSMAALPFALGSMFKKAYGQTTPTLVDVLNFALTLEYLEQEFYTKALEASLPPAANNPLIPSGLDQSAIMTIRDHETRHVEFLQHVIVSLGGTPKTKPVFDFTGGKGTPNGAFPTVFSDYDAFLAVAQAVEDLGVRAYKGGAPLLMSNNNILTSVLRIHSVEARHAAHIRGMRRLAPSAFVAGDVRPWVTLKESNINSADADSIYAGEENTLQANIQINGINGQLLVGPDVASQSFDEPLSMQEVLLIIDPFLVP